MFTKVFLTAIAAACGIGALWHETIWRRRRHWKATKGIVIDHVEQDSFHPRIEYKVEGVAHSFVSLYGGTDFPAIHEDVEVRYDPASLQAEWYTATNRWLFTIVPGIFCAGFLALAWLVPEGTSGDSGD